MEGAGERWAEAQANVNKLNDCPRHRFELSDEDIAKGVGALFGKQLVCLRCNGRMRLQEINQYVRGFAAAGGNLNDVLPGWNNDETDGRTQRKFFTGSGE